MRRVLLAVLGLVVSIAGCEEATEPEVPAPPRELSARYYARAVYLTWELAPEWDEESFRVYGKRSSDRDYFRIAEVTNCRASQCSYTDINVVAGVVYQYYVAAVHRRSGVETPSDHAVEVPVPEPTPPPAPGGLSVVALDGALYVRWSATSRSAGDFSHYRVYLRAADRAGEPVDLLLGETDSEGFLDLRVENGRTYRYYVSALDTLGHESQGSQLAEGTPRPDFQGEWIYAFQDRPDRSGFRFRSSEAEDPIVSGSASERHFRLEVDVGGWWLAPGPDAAIYPRGFATTALTCGVGSDTGCEALTRAPTSAYVRERIALYPQTTYALRVAGADGRAHYGAVRAVLLGFDQNDTALMIFEWAYQLQPDNPSLVPAARLFER
ncbi:MAG: hypothetical protein HY704_04215 [Gemmatimonadetes bacterium]|nr:hypothetical protein [Gemmatimonadota bacterium]